MVATRDASGAWRAVAWAAPTDPYRGTHFGLPRPPVRPVGPVVGESLGSYLGRLATFNRAVADYEAEEADAWSRWAAAARAGAAGGGSGEGGG